MKSQTTIRVEAVLLEKLKLIAHEERRSVNGTIELFIANGIKIYEKEHGEVIVPE